MLSYIWPSTMTLTTTQYWNNSNLHMQMLPLLFLSVPIEVQMINQQMINHSGHGTGQLWRKNTKYRLFVICCQCLHFCCRGFSKLWPLFGFVAKSQNLFVVIKIWCLGCCKNKESLKLAQNLQVALSCLKWVLQERERESMHGVWIGVGGVNRRILFLSSSINLLFPPPHPSILDNTWQTERNTLDRMREIQLKICQQATDPTSPCSSHFVHNAQGNPESSTHRLSDKR